MDPRVVLIAAACAGLWYVGTKTVDGVKHVNHKIGHVFRKSPPKPPEAK